MSARDADRQSERGQRTLLRGRLHRLRYPLPTLWTTAEQRHPPTVYFCSPDINRPSGGIRVAYRHVDILNSAGVRARILHARPGFRCTWFEHRTAIVSDHEEAIGPWDVVVVSEVAAGLLRALPSGHRYVVFNQGPHLTWTVPGEAVRRYTYSSDLAMIVTVSDHALEMLSYAAPGVPVRRIHNSVDPAIFFPGEGDRPRRISYMARRGGGDVEQILAMLETRGALASWEVSALGNLSEGEVGEELRSTSIFLSVAHQEGFGLPAAEAMACGAYVVGFHGLGGREFFRPAFSSPVEQGNTLAAARALEAAIDREAAMPGWLRERGAAAASFVAREYPPMRERQELLSIYSEILERAADTEVGARGPW